MRLGYVLPNIGPLASAANVVSAAERAEALDFDTVWVTDRLLFPLEPRTKYPGTPDGSLPDPYRQSLDPMVVLSFVAGSTTRVGLGTSVLDAPFHNPAVLARAVAALDVLSGGRVRLGLGLGWSADEYEAAGQPMAGRGRRLDEFLRVLKTAWTADRVEFTGEFFSIPPAVMEPKPVQPGGPKITLGTFSPKGLQRAATLADGIHPTAVPPRILQKLRDGLFAAADEAGRDRADLEVVIRANLNCTEEPQGEKRWPFSGDDAQLADDIAAVKEFGATELLFDPSFSPDTTSMDAYLRRMERMRELCG